MFSPVLQSRGACAWQVAKNSSASFRRWASGFSVAFAAVLFFNSPLPAQVNVVTHHNDIARTGVNSSETILTPANVNSTNFGKLFSYPVDGMVFAQPLYMLNVAVSGKGTHNVVFVATEHDSVYAFDADSNSGANSSPLWRVTLLDSAHGAAAGATSVPSTDYPETDIPNEIGITGTPVIDPSTNTLYVVSKTKESGSYVQRLHALDISSGAEKFGGPVTLAGSVPGTGNGSAAGTLTFDPFWENQRPGLLLLNGVIYIGFGAHQDLGPWHGWLLAYYANTLQQRAVYCSTPNGSASGVWLSGGAPPADVIDPVNAPYGRTFLTTGNGSFNAAPPYDNTMSFGDDVERLDLSTTINAPGANPSSFPQQLPVTDSFTPSNQATLDLQDKDLGAGNPVILPDQSVGGHTHLMAEIGKNGTLYLIDRDAMGGFNSTTDNIVQEFAATAGMWGNPAFWNNTLYVGGSYSVMKTYTLSAGLFNTTPQSLTSQYFSFPGPTPSISSNGNTNGIVWGLQTEAYATNGPAVLFAWDATNLASQLYASNQVSPRDTAGGAVKFAVPTVSNGKVYVGTASELDVYGLLAGAQSAATPVISPSSQSFNGSISVTITDSTTGATIYYTLDGTVPTTSSTKYTGAITVTATTTVNAIATASGFAESGMASATYTQNLATAATPTFSPAGGTYTSAQSVTISDTTSGATIFYTTNGTAPTTSSSVYSAPISVSSSQTIKAIATASGFAQSAVGSAAYTINLPQAATPTFSPVGGTYTGTQSVTLSDATTGSTIFYTTNGTTPTTSSPVYSGPISVSSSETINAMATAPGFAQSAVGAAAYTINIPQAATPTFSPAGGTYTSTQSVTISDTTSGAIIYYTTNGTTPTTSSSVYSAPISVSSSQTIKAIAAASGFTQSAVASASYTINLPVAAAPTYAPAGGTYTTAQTVTISDATSGATIYYTTNGTTPTTSSSVYSGPIAVSSTETINAMATAPGFTQSAVSSSTYIINTSGTLSLNLSSGFSNTYPLSLNGAAKLNGTALQLTDGVAGETSTAWYGQPLNIQSFTTDFSIQMSGGTVPMADGIAFVIHNASTGLQTVGPSGGGLGYGPDQPSGSGGIPNSIAIKFDTFNNAGETPDSTGLYVNGASPTVPSIDLTNSGITLTNTHVFKVHLTYDGTTLAMTITDATTNASFSTSWPINIPATVGSPTAYVGFTAATGAQTAIQSVLNWSFSGPVPSAPATYQAKALPATSSGPSFSNLYYSGFPDNYGVLFGSANVGDNLTFSLFVPVPGTYDVKVSSKVTTSRGISQLSVNGTNVGSPFDQYSATTANVFFDLGNANITSAGLQSFKFTLTGKNAASSGTSLIFDDIVLTPQINSAPPAAAPTFSPAAGTYTSVQSVTLSDTTAGATIFYTLDGTTPNTTVGGSTLQYSSPISVSSNLTINAIATASGFSKSAVSSAAYVINLPAASAPTFTPAAGTYAAVQSVTLSDSTTGASIFYTTNGTTPTTASTLYSGPIAVNSTTTINAIATAPGFSQSSVASALYTINLPPTATPTFSPVAGTYTTTQSVTLSDTTSGAVIYYTTNGTTPTTSSTKYTAPITVSANTTINAIALATGFSQSAVGTAAYTITPPAATPTFSPAAGTYATTQSVTLSDATTGATIFYTTDGSTPTTASTKYTAPISVSATTTINAIATATGFTQSAVGTASYTITPPAATPTFSPAPGLYATAQNVTLSDSTSGATIFYTTNGTTPTTSSTVYTAPIAVSASTTINAIATAPGFSQSAVASGAYTIGSTAASFSFSTGFSGAPLAIRGSAKLNGTALEINDGLAGEASAIWYGQPLSIGNFTSDFSFQMTPASTTSADGMAFVIQNAGVTALGSSGGGLGYTGITNSVAVKFDLYNNSGEGVDSTGIYTNGAAPTIPATDLSASGIDLHSGHVFNVHLAYDGTNLSLKITDATTNAVFNTSWPINIPATVGSSTAYVGFTGGTGGSAVTTNVNSWSFSSALAKTPATYATANLPRVSSGPSATVFTFSAFPDGNGIYFTSGKVGDNISFTLNTLVPGTYDVKVSMKTTTSRGIMQLSVNGTNVGPPTDTYSNTTGSYAVFDLGNVTISAAGSQTFVFTVTGKNAASTGYLLSFDDITLTQQ